MSHRLKAKEVLFNSSMTCVDFICTKANREKEYREEDSGKYMNVSDAGLEINNVETETSIW